MLRLAPFAGTFKAHGFDDPLFWPELGDDTLQTLGFQQGLILKWRKHFPEPLAKLTHQIRRFQSTESPGLSALPAPPDVPELALEGSNSYRKARATE